jgi:cytochrome c oxidase cbb3-type subunit II
VGLQAHRAGSGPVGGRYSNEWHVQHLIDPRSVVPESIMPSYAFLLERAGRVDNIADHLKANRAVGVPYDDEMIANARADLWPRPTPPPTPRASSALPQGQCRRLRRQSEPHQRDGRAVAYLQMLGTLVDFSTYDEMAGRR